MTGLTPRDTREWMRTVERGLLNARGAASSIAGAVVEKRLDDYATEVNNDRNRVPAPPIELTSQTYIALGANKRFQAGVIVDFPDVTIGNDALPMAIEQYELWGRTGTANFVLLTTNVESALQWFGAEPGSVWNFKVRARGTLAVKPGVFSSVISVTMLNDTTAPGQPSTPTLSTQGKTMTIKWDGKVAGGGSMPLDLDYVSLAAGNAASPTTEVFRMPPGPSLFVDTGMAYNTPRYYRLQAVDTSGNRSAWSAQVSGVAAPLVDDDVILATIDAAETEIINIGAASILNGAINNAKLADNAVSQAKLQDQIISLAKLDTTVDAKITKGVTDAAAADGKAVTAQAAADAAQAKVDTLAASGANLALNGDLEAPIPAGTSSPAYWSSRQLAYCEVDARSRSGAQLIRLAPTTSVAFAYSSYIEAAVGRTFYFETWVRLGAANVTTDATATLMFAVNITRFDNTTNTITVTPTAPFSFGSVTTTGWTKMSGSYTIVDANAKNIRVAPRGAGNGNSYLADDLRVVDFTEAKAALDAAAQAQTDATQAISDAAVALGSANGKNTITNSTADAGVGIPGKTSGDRWQKWTTLGTGGKLLATWRWNGSTWIAEAMDPTYIPLLDIGAGTFGSLGGDRLVANSVRTSALTVTDLTNFAPSLADQPADPTKGDYGLTGQMQIIASSIDTTGYRFSVVNGTVESRAYGPMKAVAPGESLWMGANLYRGSGTVGAYLRYEFLDSNKIGLTGGVGINYVNVPQSSTSATGTRFEGPAIVPAGAAYARWYIIISAGTGSTGFYNIQGRRRLAGELLIDGTVTSNAIATNAVVARNILVGDFQNFAIGGDFEDPAAVPFTLATNHTLTTSQKKSGTTSLRLAAATGFPESTLTADLRVKEGEQYYFKYHAYIDAAFNGSTSNSKLRVGDQNNAHIASKTYADIARSAWTTDPLEMTVTVPAGVTSLTVKLVSDNTAGTAYVDDIQIRRVSEASLIMNLGVEKLTASTAGINTAVIDKLYTEVVRSRRMTTDMMVVGRGVNGIVDEFFDAADTKTYRNTLTGGWGTWGVSASNSLNMYTAGTLAPGTSRSFYFDTVATYDKNSYIPVEPDQRWRLAVQYTSGTSGPRATIRYIKRDGSIGYTSVGWLKKDGTSNVFDPAGTLRTLERVYTVPSDVAYIMPAVQFDSTCTSATVYGGATLTNMASAALIVEGAISTRHLTVTEDMTVALLSAHKVMATEIDTNDLAADVGFIGDMTAVILTVDSVKATQIDATGGITSKHTITGATIQTLTTANRGIKISGGNFSVYDATGTGNKTFSITGSTGAVTGTGVWKTGSAGNYIEMTADAGGGLLRFWTGSGTGRGNIYARDDAGGKRMTITYSDLDNPGYTVPLLALWDDKVSLDYGSKHIRVGKTSGGGEELVLDATGADVLIKGGLELSDSSARVRWRYSSSNFTLGYLGQRPETNSGIADFELRAAANGVRISGTELIANPIYNNTSSSAANVFVDSNGKVWRSTSASKYKADQRVLTVPDSLLDIQLKDWVDKNQLALFEEMSARAPFADETDQSRFDAINLTREPGVIAEDVEAHGGEQFAIYGPDGAIEGVKYERLALAQIQILYRRLLEAEQKIEELQRA